MACVVACPDIIVSIVHLNEEVTSTNTKHVWIAKDTARNRNLVVKAVKSDLSFSTIHDVHRLWVAVGKSKDSLKEWVFVPVRVRYPVINAI
jgi:hypothetical protein